MPKITQEQITKWNEKNPHGFRLDWKHYVMYGEKEIARYIQIGEGKRLEVRLCYLPEYERKTNGWGCRWTVETGRYIPSLHFSIWQDSGTAWVSHGMGWYVTVGEVQKKKKYTVLQTVAQNITTQAAFDHFKNKTGEILTEYNGEIA